MNETTRKTVMNYITQNEIANFLPILDWLEEHYDGFQARIYGGERNTFGERKILDVKWIEVHGIKAVRDVRTMVIEPGVTLLYGPNDSGKSTYLDALVFALSKRTYNSAAPEDLITHDMEKGTATVYLGTAEGEKGPNMIQRAVTSKVKKKGAKVGTTEVKYALDVTLAGVDSTSAADAEANLALYLGQPFDTLRRCFLVAQGQLDALLDEQPGKRQAIFFKMLALEPCETTRERLAGILKGAEEDVGHNLTKAMEYKLEISGDRKKLEELGDLEAASKRLAELDKAVKAAEKYTATADAVVATKNAQRQALDLLKKNLEFCDDLRAKRQQLADLTDGSDWDGDDGPTLEYLELQVSGLVERGAKLVARRDFIKEAGVALKTAPLECPICATMGKKCETTPEQRAARRAELLAEYKRLDAEVTETREAWREAAHQRDKRKQATKDHDEAVKTYENAGEAIAHIDAELKRVNVTREMVAKAQKEYDQVQGIPRPEGDETEGAFAEAKRIRERLDEAVRLASNIKEKKAKLAEAEERSGEKAQTWLTRIRAVLFAFQKDGIPLWIAQQHLSEINEYARELCDGDRYRYGFATDLSIQIVDNQNEEGQVGDLVHPALASGSSRQRAALVLQAALARWQCRMNGVQPQLFWIDELPFQNEEQHGAQCVALIKRLTQWFPKVVIAASNWAPYAGKFDHEVALLGKPIHTSVPGAATPDLPVQKASPKEAQAKMHAEMTKELDRQVYGPGDELHRCVFVGNDQSICCAMGHAAFEGRRRAAIPPVPMMTQAEVEAATKPKRARRTKAEMEAARQAESVKAEVVKEAHRENRIMGTEPPDRDENAMGSNSADYNDDPHWSPTGDIVADDEPF